MRNRKDILILYLDTISINLIPVGVLLAPNSGGQSRISRLFDHNVYIPYKNIRIKYYINIILLYKQSYTEIINNVTYYLN